MDKRTGKKKKLIKPKVVETVVSDRQVPVIPSRKTFPQSK
jgi:hypothetical protein